MSISSISRRQFLTGASVAGVAGLAAASVGLSSCSPTTNNGAGNDANSNAAGTTGSNGSAASGNSANKNTEELIAAAYLNPQDYNYRQNTTDFKTLFSPIKIGSVESSHRMIKSAAGSAAYLAGPGDELLQYYVQMAKGGVELIWVENIPFFEDGIDFATMTPRPVTEEGLGFAKTLVDECAKYGAKLGYQWAPFGMPVANMPKEQIASTQAAGVKIAKDLQACGFVGLEINAAGFNQGEQFLSRFHNTRTDEYGVATLENRARFVTECIKQIKLACGKDFVVQCLIDCIEENDNITNDATLATLDNAVTGPHNKVTTIEEGIAFAKLFEAAGADAMHLRLGPLGNHPCQFGSDLYFILNGIEGATGYGMQWDFKRHWQGQLIANHSGAGMLIDIVARYKQALSIPCGTVTYMDPAHAPDFFEKALADGKVDFFIMNRPLTVDNEYVNKLREGRIDEIAPCTRCLHCHIGSNEMNRAMGYCRVNALTQRVLSKVPGTPDSYELIPATTPKKVMVVGGGPAGMEAARIAAARGHNVSVYEKKGSLGGLLDFASSVKGPHENLGDLKNYLVRQLEISNVNVQLNTEVDAALITSEAPDVLVLAIGGKRDSSKDANGVLGNITDSDNVKVIDFDSFMTADIGENVVICGGNAQAWDCALWLTVHKKNVTLVTSVPDEELDAQQSQHAQRFITTALYSLGVKVWSDSKIKTVGDGKIVVSTGFGVDVTVPCDTIITGAEQKPNDDLLNAISVAESYAIGDCKNPFNIAMAIRDGNDIGRML
ncbi:MAG: FAD-dependent oxidoreductase [Coriobacteriales bacterium]|jgi:2,4-dienoyl-CoA reductase-like NADH-dependent reductase (Old Yellow Enzyme family)/thioredoxin reductase|nr:FAD-dependent oxidoreductase [Coriobacteriales bacterium]